ncbi:MAG: hypothetical protein ACOVQS_08260, partial [Chitinophagaceae bacterium]
ATGCIPYHSRNQRFPEVSAWYEDRYRCNRWSLHINDNKHMRHMYRDQHSSRINSILQCYAMA